MSTTPPPYLERDFDPTKVKVAELRGILLAHDVPYSSAAKKSQLVALYEQHIRPQAPALLAELRAVRASAEGVLDGESQGSTSLRELDTEPEDVMDEAPAPRARARTRKSLSAAATARDNSGRTALAGTSAKPKVKTRGKSRAVPQPVADSEDEEEDASMEEAEPVVVPPSRRRGQTRKSIKAPSPPIEMDIDVGEDLYEAPHEYEAPLRGVSPSEEEDEKSEDMAASPPRLSSPKKRKEPATPRLSELVKMADSPGEGNFSDFNPFQSGGEETPQRDPKRRKSSVGPSRLRETDAASSRLKSRKSMPALPSQRRELEQAGSWGDPPQSAKRSRASDVWEHAPEPEPVEEEEDDDMPPVPPRPSSSRAKQQRASLGVASTSSTPVGVPYMVPVNKVKTTPPQVAEMLRRYETTQSGAVSPAPSPAAARTSATGRIAGPSPQLRKKSSSPVRELVQSSAKEARSRVGEGRQPVADAIQLRKANPASSSSSLMAALPSSETVRRTALAMMALLALSYLFWRREETVAIGYCDTGVATNERMARRDTSLAFPALPALPPRVDAFLDASGLRPGCTMCPTHGRCAAGEFVGCTYDYVALPPGWLRSLGGWLPAPSVCVPDTAKQVAIARQASAGARLLRRRKGEVICRGLEPARRRAPDQKKKKGGAGGGGGDQHHDAYVFGLDAGTILDELARANELEREPIGAEYLEEINRLALRDLEAHGEVIVWENGDQLWYASQVADMTLGCRARLFAKSWIRQHKLPLTGVLAVLASLVWLRHRLAQRRLDDLRRDQLVAVALRQLQQQARAHHDDPVHTPFAHFAPSHLRDLVLQEEHSPARRARLWAKVAHVVEGNANVRVKDVEVQGEELRGWEWTGPVVTAAAGAAGAEERERPVMVEGGKGAAARGYPSLVSMSPAAAAAVARVRGVQ